MKALNKITSKVSNLFLSLYARLLDQVQGTEWWKAHLKRKAEQRWQTIREAARSTFTEEELKIWGPVIDNELSYLKTNDIANGTTPTAYDPNRIMMCATKAMRNLQVLRNVVGLQPLSGPTGLVYSIRYRLEDITEGGTDTGVKSMKLEVISNPALAGTRKLQARWNVEAVQDLSIVHGLNLDADLTSAIGAEVSYEVVNEVIYDLFQLGSKNTVTVDPADVALPFVGDLGVLATININRAALRIAERTRRGAGNFIIASAPVIALLQSCPKSVFESVRTEDGDYCTLRQVGILNKSIKVYASMHEKLENHIIIGYKGVNGETDTGYIYSPYIPLMSSGVVMDPLTFQPVVSMMTRYAKTLSKPSNLETANASDYYAVIDVTALNQKMAEMLTPPVESVDKPTQDPVQ